MLRRLRFSTPIPISALYERTHAEPQGPFVVPGKYEVRLTVDGKTYKQPLIVEMDPRVKVTQAELQQQLDFAQKIDRLVTQSFDFHQQAAKFQSEVADRQAALEKNDQAKAALQALKDFDAKVMKIQGEMQRGFGGFGKPKPTFTLMNSEFANLSEAVDQADAAPTAAMHTAYNDYCGDLTKLAQQWSDLMKQDLPAVNAQLTEQHLQPLRRKCMLSGSVRVRADNSRRMCMVVTRVLAPPAVRGRLSLAKDEVPAARWLIEIQSRLQPAEHPSLEASEGPVRNSSTASHCLRRPSIGSR